MARACPTNSPDCAALSPCDLCRGTVRVMAVVPALMAAANAALEAACQVISDEERREDLRMAFPEGLLTEEVVLRTFEAFDEGWRRCAHLQFEHGASREEANPVAPARPIERSEHEGKRQEEEQEE